MILPNDFNNIEQISLNSRSLFATTTHSELESDNSIDNVILNLIKKEKPLDMEHLSHVINNIFNNLSYEDMSKVYEAHFFQDDIARPESFLLKDFSPKDPDNAQKIDNVLRNLSELNSNMGDFKNIFTSFLKKEPSSDKTNAQDILGLLGDLRSTVETATSNEKIGIVKASLDEISSNATARITSLLKNVFHLGSAAAMAIYYLNSPSYTRLLLLVAALLNLYYNSTIDISTIILDFFSKMYSMAGTLSSSIARPESGLNLTLIATFISAVLSTYALTSDYSLNTWSIMNQLKSFASVSKGINELAIFSLDICTWLVNLIRNKIFGLPSIRFFEIHNDKVNSLIKRVDNLIELNRTHKLIRNTKNYEMILFLVKETNSLVLEFGKLKDNGGIMKLLTNMYHELNKLKTLFIAANITTQGAKTEPVGVMLYGPPGVGKSILLNTISDRFATFALPKEEHKDFFDNRKNYIFNRQSENVFWDGYIPTALVCQIDDFGQAKDIAGTPDNEWMNVIRMISSFEMQLHCAAMDSKGNSHFRAKMVICSTNLRSFQPVSIADVNAVARRFPVSYVVTPKIQYCTEDSKGMDIWNRKIDANLLPKVYLETRNKMVTDMSPEIVEFYQYTVRGEIVGEAIQFEDVIHHIEEEFYKREEWQELEEQNRRYFKEALLDEEEYHNQFPFEEKESITNNPSALPESALPIDNQTCSSDFSFDTSNSPENFFETEDSIQGDKEFEEYILKLEEEFMREDPDILLNQNTVNEFFSQQVIDIHENMIDTFRNKLKQQQDYIRAGLYQLLKFDRIMIMPWIQIMCLVIMIYKKDARRFLNTPPNRLILDNRFDIFKKLKNINLFDSYVLFITKTKKHITTFADGLVDIIAGWSEYSIYRKTGVICAAVLSGASIALTLFLSYKCMRTVFNFIYSFFFSKEELDSEIDTAMAELGYGSSPLAKTKAPRPSNAVLRDSLAKLTSKPQGSGDIDSNGKELVHKIKRRNMYKLEVEETPGHEDYVGVGNFTVLKGRIAIWPKHYISSLVYRMEQNSTFNNSKARITSIAMESKYSIVIDIKDLIVDYSSDDSPLTDIDAVLVELNSRFNTCQDISQFYISENDIPSLPKMMNFMMPLRGEIYSGMTEIVTTSVAIDAKDTGYYEIPRAFKYLSVTKSGDCGSPIVILNSKNIRKIAGFHVAGNPSINSSYSTIITKEVLDIALSTFNKPIIDVPLEQVISNPERKIPEEFKHLNYLGDILNPTPKFNKPTICKSALHDKVWKSKMKPAHLKMQGDKDPMKIAIVKYCTSRFTLDNRITLKVMDTLKYKIGFYDQNIKRRLMTLKEVLDGTELLDYFNKIPSSTSPGYPMNTPHVENLKHLYYFGNPLQKETSLIKITELVDQMETQLLNYERPEIYFTDNLKEERRPIEKVDAFKTRLFQGSPFIYLIMIKMYFGSFTRFCISNRINNGMVIGVNPYSEEWDTIYHKMKYKDPSMDVGAGDYSAFDGSEDSYIHLELLNLINEWYSDSYSLQRKILWLELTNSKHIVNNMVFEWNGSLPSGHPLTIFINSLYNLFSIEYAFIRCCEENNVPHSNEAYAAQVCGDDLIYSVSPPYKSYFNELTLPTYLRELNLKYTTELKGTALTPFRKLSEVEFLKRKFVWSELAFRYIAPMRLEDVLEICLWTKNGSDKDAITCQNVEQVIREVSLHDKNTFMKYMKPLVECYNKEYAERPLPKYAGLKYEEIHREVLASDGFFQ